MDETLIGPGHPRAMPRWQAFGMISVQYPMHEKSQVTIGQTSFSRKIVTWVDGMDESYPAGKHSPLPPDSGGRVCAAEPVSFSFYCRAEGM